MHKLKRGEAARRGSAETPAALVSLQLSSASAPTTFLPPMPRVKLRLFATGCCTHPEWVTLRGGSLRAVPIPALFALIEHPQKGLILFDTGYASRFYSETSRWPQALYRWVTPVLHSTSQDAARQLAKLGVKPDDVSAIVISHFHADHIAGLRDFPSARFLYRQAALDAVQPLTGLRAVRAAYLPGLLPDDFAARALPIDGAPVAQLPQLPLGPALDVLGDGSLLAVDLPGHAAGQIGLLLATDRGPRLLCADAAWSSAAFRDNRPPHWLAGLIMPSRDEYRRSFAALVETHRAFPELLIIPSHCGEARRRFVEGGELL